MGCQKSGGAATGVCVCPTGVGDEGQEVASHRSDAVCCWWGHTHTKPRGGGAVGGLWGHRGGSVSSPLCHGTPWVSPPAPPRCRWMLRGFSHLKAGWGLSGTRAPPQSPIDFCPPDPGQHRVCPLEMTGGDDTHGGGAFYGGWEGVICVHNPPRLGFPFVCHPVPQPSLGLPRAESPPWSSPHP